MELTLNNEKNLKEINLENKQNSFLDSTLWKVVNTGLNAGIRALLPNLIEDQVIDVKDAIIKSGFKTGAKQAINSAIDLGKSAKGIVTGDFEDISQAHDAIKTGGIIDSVSSALNFAIGKGMKAKIIPEKTGNILLTGKDVLMNTIESNIESNFNKQLKAINLLGKYEENWNLYYNNKDTEGMEREYRKINETIKKIMPTRNTIIKAEQILNKHKLLRNKGFDFNLSNEELNLAESLVY
jgi:hypothetical protein